MSSYLFEPRSIGINRIDIWQINLSLSPTEVLELEAILNPEERARADRFKFDIHKNRFIVARGRLRQILSVYLDIKPEKIEFQYGDRGKPHIADDRLNLQFNLSHSEDLAVCAVTKNNRIGIDIEYIKEKYDCANIAKRFFTVREAREIESIDEPDRSRYFLRLWTAKEAFLKAMGDGLAGSLDKIEICWDKERYIYAIEGNIDSNWQLIALDLAADYLAAVAVENSTEISTEYIKFT
jgi:4'-phosphopantetheinyl transferase